MITRLRILNGLGQEHPAAPALKMHAGKVAVSEHMAPEDDGSGFLTVDDLQSDGLTDLGTVIASGDEQFEVCDVVVMQPLHGKYIRNFKSGGMNYPLVRLFGCMGDVLQPAHDALLAKIKGDTIKVTKNRALVALDEFVEQTQSGLYIPDRAQATNGKLTILDVGPTHTETKPGDRCIYSGYGLLSFPVTDEMAAKYPGFDAKNICLIEESHLLATLTDE